SVGKADEDGIARAVVHNKVGVFDREVECGGEQVFHFALVFLEEVLLAGGVVVFAGDDGGFEKAGGGKLPGIAGDHHAAAAGEHRVGFFQAPLRVLVKDDDIEERGPGKNL